MSFDWFDFLALADALSRNPTSPGPEEASLRSAISRAYYAAYCSVRNFADARGEILLRGKASDHWLVINHFRRSPDASRQKIGNQLDRLRRRRNKADYDDVLVARPVLLARASVAVARNVLNALNSL